LFLKDGPFLSFTATSSWLIRMSFLHLRSKWTVTVA